MKSGIQTLAALALGLLFSTAALAQAPAEERAMTMELAHAAMEAAEAEARANNWNLTIVIVDADGVPVMVHRMDGASARSYEIAMGKAHTVITTGLLSGEYGTRLEAGQIQAIEGGITFAGGVPVYVDGEVIGAVTSSGARGIEDEQVSKVGAEAIGSWEN